MDLLVKKAISLVLLMSVLMGTALMVPQKTQAADPITWAVCGAYEATIGKLFGAIGDKVEGVITGALDNVAGVTTGAAPVNDATTHAGQRSQVSNEKKTECERFVADVALATLKKRLLNIMTDNVVEWINNDFKSPPKFTQDFGKVFREAGDQAVGDVLLQYESTKVLCQPFNFDITFQLQQPAPLAQRAQCTLTSVIKSFESYRDDFKNGGWIGYQELLKPQNNQWGVELLTQSEITSRTALKTNSSALKETVNAGFDSSECTGGWDLMDKRTKQLAKAGPEIDQNTINSYGHINKGDVYHGKTWDDPKLAPPSPAKSSQNFFYSCAGTTITTPGRTLAAGLEKSVWKDFDFISDSQELSNSLAIIADAAFNKLIKTGVNGIQNFFKPNDSEENKARDEDQRDRINQASENYDSVHQQINDNKAVSAYLDQINPAASTILAASTTLTIASSTNWKIITTGEDILECLSGNPSHPDVIVAQNAINTANLNKTVITGKSTEVKAVFSSIQTLISQINAGTCDAITCQSQINDRRTAAGTINIDSNNILASIQSSYNDLQIRKKNNNCGG